MREETLSGIKTTCKTVKNNFVAEKVKINGIEVQEKDPNSNENLTHDKGSISKLLEQDSYSLDDGKRQ